MQAYLEPRYLVFELPFFTAVFFFVLQGLGDADHDHEIVHDVDHDLDLASHGVEGGAESDHDSEQADSATFGILTFLGFGKVPLFLLLGTFFILWGIAGWLTLRFVESVIPVGWIAFLPALVVAGVVSIVGTNRLSTLLARAVPRFESYDISPEELVGTPGKARFQISDTFGSVQVYDRHHTFHEVEARVHSGESSVPSGADVVLMNYDRERGAFYVITAAEFQELIDR